MNTATECPNCKSKIVSSAKFCPECGEKMVTPVVAHPASAKGAKDFRRLQSANKIEVGSHLEPNETIELPSANPENRPNTQRTPTTAGVAKESASAAAFADASDLDTFTGSWNNNAHTTPSVSADSAESISTEEASELLDQLLSPAGAKQRQPEVTTVESATLSGFIGNTDREIQQIRPGPLVPSMTAPARPSIQVGAQDKSSRDSRDEDSDVVPVERVRPDRPQTRTVAPATTANEAWPLLPGVVQPAPAMQSQPVPMQPPPMMIPVPMPQWTAPATSQPPAETPKADADHAGDSAFEKVRLPDPESVAKPATAPEAPQEISENREIAQSSNEPSIDARQRERVLAIRRLNKLIERAKAELLQKQEPLTGKAPRALRKSIDKLETLDQSKFDDVVNQLNQIAKAQSPFALQTLRDYAISRQIRYKEAAAEGLSRISAPAAAIALLDLLQDDVAAVSGSALSGIMRMGFTETVPVLVALGRVDGRSRVKMREELGEWDDAAKEQLVVPLKEAVKTKGDPAASAFAINLLAQLKGGELLKMYASLTRHSAAPIRVAAIEALVQTEENQIVRFLNGSIKDPDPRVRAAAATGMARISSPKSESLLIAALQDDQASVRQVAAQTLVEFRSKAVAAAASRALNSETDHVVLEFLLEIVSRGGTDDALITLQKYLESDDRELQHRAMATLRRLKNARAARLVAPLLRCEHPETRRLAVETVGLLKNMSVVADLREILKADSEDQIRAAAARSLGELKDDEAVCLLEESLHDSRTVRCQSVIALGSIGKKESVPALLAQLRDAAPEVRYHACNSLGQIGGLPDPEPLQNLLEDKEAMVRRGAEAALTKMGHKVGQAKLARRLRKTTAFLMPSVLAGALPGGTAMIVAVVLLVAVGIGYKTMNTIGAAGETAFPVSDVHAIAVNHDGSQVSVARKFNVLEVWDTSSGQLTAQFQADAGAAGIVYRKNGNALILAGSKSFEMDIARVASDGKQALADAAMNNLSTHRVATTPDGTKTLLCTAAGKATLVDMETQKQMLSFQVKDFTDRDAVAINPDATLALVGTAGGHLKVFSLQDGKPLGRLNISQRIGSPGTGITALAMDSAGTMIAVGTSSGSVVVVGIDQMDVVGKPYSGAGRIVGLVFQGDSKQLNAVTSRRELITCRSDFASAKKLTTSLSEIPEKVAFSANGSVAAFFYSESDKFCVVDLAKDKVLTVYPDRG